MSCEDNVCGTGNGNVPKPGDPSNAEGLTATPAFGGIDVAWVFPAVNSFAVAHTKLYRSTSSSFDSALDLFIVSGNFFYDKTPSGVSIDTRFYYWIQLVSVNGTVGELIGPASAVARPLIAQAIELLSGQIDAGLLAQSLKTSINKIETIDSGLTAEINDRIKSNSDINSFLTGVQTTADSAVALNINEVAARTNADGVLLNALNLQAVSLGNSIAGAMDRITLLAGPDSSLAKRVTSVETDFGINKAAVTNSITALANADKSTALEISTVKSTFASNSAIVQQQINTLADKDTALASQVNTVQSVLGDQIASVETKAETSINTVTGKINSLWTAKVDVNGLVGGFGLANDGETVEAGFNVDRFWIGRPGDSKTLGNYPFIVDDNIVYIKEAAIKSLTFNKLRDEAGSFLVENGKIKADYLSVKQITGGSFTGYAWPPAGQTGFYLGPGGLGMGNINALPGASPSYVLIRDTGDFYAPGFNIIGGKMTIDALNVIGTLNIRNNSVSYAGSTGGSGTNTSITIAGHGGRCLVIAKCVLNTNGNVGMTLTVNGGGLDSAFVGGGGNAIAGTATCSGTFNTVDGVNYTITMQISSGSGDFYNPGNTSSTLTYIEVLK